VPVQSASASESNDGSLRHGGRRGGAPCRVQFAAQGVAPQAPGRHTSPLRFHRVLQARVAQVF